MTEDDKMAFSAIMYPLGKIYDLGIEDKHIMKVWFEALSDLDIDEVAKAVMLYLKSPDFGTYKPKPADIIRMIEGTSIDKSFTAWSKVENAARRVGSYATVVFDDPIIQRVVQDMGGWVGICQKPESELPFVKNEFCSRYKGFSTRKEIPDHPKKLFGIIDCSNGAQGYREESKPVLIGESKKALLVLEGKMKPVPNFLLELPN